MDNAGLSSHPLVLWTHTYLVKLIKDVSPAHRRLSHPQSETVLGGRVPNYEQYGSVLATPGTLLVSASRVSRTLIQVTAHVAFLVALHRVSLC